ncbi:hypothetical protein CGLO_15253 [Colletotrichum gloeosporioides Cg-14]|uniref:Nucleoside phosphorylase domain-containing protein n=1 Tax=Colletotrichum gloeosporioides (strain Cg-14) TaxID=1237896 RepID=T0K265_COLGC|nr:hypothetical protein CGLO_15253 [Colletotrichum gloeosporioides Cg-14]
METEEEPLSSLLKDVQGQLQSFSSIKPPQSISGSGILHIEAQDDDPYYLQTLVHFRAFILECIANGRPSIADVEWEHPLRHPLNSYGSFWGKFLKLARSSADFIHPTRMLDKLDTFRNISERSLPEEDITPTDDIWADERVRQWVVSAEPPQLYLYEPPQRSSRLQKFGIELLRHLEKFIPVIHMLGGQQMLTKFLRCPVSPASVVEQLAYQAIFHLPTKVPLSRLSVILSLLKKATNEAEWFELLEFICSTLETSRVAIVIEIADIPPAMISDVKRWPLQFTDMSKNTIRPTEISISREQIRLAIVCALTLEADAVHALFDEYWEDLEPRNMRSPGDTNAYSFGVFGKFATVLVHMPGMGKTSASIVATNCRNSFPNLKLALVVGICGGVPFSDRGKTEIVLGDVIISEGLVPYDYGRQFPDRFLRKDSTSDVLGRPPTELRGLLSKLKTRVGRRRLQERTVSHQQVLRRELGIEVEHLGAEQDHLYEGAYMHRHQNPDVCRVCSDNAICQVARESTCEELACDKGKLVGRKRLEAILRDGTGLEPGIHFGKIACGDQVMKSGQHRDSIAKDEGVIAFEMEGAGVWGIFPCLVIKAVCDYADSHKHKKWQNYAAGTAAACTKALIQEWYM